MDNPYKEMKWVKLGKLFEANGQREWMSSHTACPTPFLPSETKVRVYFGTRNSRQRPHIGYVDFGFSDEEGFELSDISDTPVLGPGEWGNFDDNGVYPGPVIIHGGKLYMYYMGRSNGVPPLYYMSIGLAESEDGGVNFIRRSPAPILGRDHDDPWMVTTPWIMKEGNDWRLWYTSGIGWKSIDQGISLYQIKYARSQDGLVWIRDADISIPIKGAETNIASPCVWREAEGYHMLYCVSRQHGGYCLERAFSYDGVEWEKLGVPLGLQLSESGWDSECMAYPSTFVFQGIRYCLYSGNQNGKEGFGIAKLGG